MATAVLDLAFGLVMAAISVAFWTARRRSPESCLDLARTGPYDVGSRGRAVYSYGMTLWTALMAMVALGGAVATFVDAVR